MKLVIGNVKTTAIIGGKDNLLETDLRKALYDYLSVKADGYNWSPAYKEGKWDGYRRFMSDRGDFATGFVELITSYAEELGATITCEDTRTNLPKVKEVFTDYIGIIDGEEWRVREYQLPAVKKLLLKSIKVGDTSLWFPRGIIDAATNAGKNSIMAGILNNLESYSSGLFLVSSVRIYKQAVAFFSQVIGEPVGEVRSGLYNPKKFTVAMVKTLYRKAKESNNVKKWLNNTDVLFVDESDEAGASEYSKVLQWVGAGMRVFVSGTPLDAGKVSNMIAIGLSGKVLHKITNAEVIEQGFSLKPIITIKLNNTGIDNDVLYKDQLKRTVHLSVTRVKLIKEMIEQHNGKQILITFIEKEHGYFMYEYLIKHLPALEDKIKIVHGTEIRKDEHIQAFQEGLVQVLLTSTILKKGANIPNIEVLILAQAGKSVITVKQFLGRGLRTDGINEFLYVYDFYDVGWWVAKHSRTRIRLLQREGFDVTEDYRQRRGIAILSA